MKNQKIHDKLQTAFSKAEVLITPNEMFPTHVTMIIEKISSNDIGFCMKIVKQFNVCFIIRPTQSDTLNIQFFSIK
ncbi:MAG: hypothetical protein Q8R96_11545 [Bacteroidota bacterium]|nr:hypothetical protein [Bacteroidota bacterium]